MVKAAKVVLGETHIEHYYTATESVFLKSLKTKTTRKVTVPFLSDSFAKLDLQRSALAFPTLFSLSLRIRQAELVCW